jgi:hypothetical protein
LGAHDINAGVKKKKEERRKKDLIKLFYKVGFEVSVTV